RTGAALREFERAVTLRPDYAQARTALEQVRAAAASSSASATIEPEAKTVRCLHCGMESRTAVSCEWCGKTLITHATVTEKGGAEVAIRSLAASDYSYLEEGPILKRLLQAVKLLIISPATAMNYALDTFYNSPGAPAAVIYFFLAAMAARLLLGLVWYVAGHAEIS